MADFLRFHNLATKVLLALAAIVVAGCSREDSSAADPERMRSVSVLVAYPPTRSIVDDGTHHVNRVLILPFRKSAENLPDDNANFLPAYAYARQVDVTLFPLTTAELHLPVGVTFKVLVLGYNRLDYDFNDRDNPANRFDFGSLATPATLANFYLAPTFATAVPEFFSSVATVYDGPVPIGETFRPEQGLALQSELRRLVSGFSVTVANVPPFVKSMTLRAGNLVRSSLAVGAAPQQWQTDGDGGNRVLGTQTPVAGVVSFNHYLLPTFAAHKTGFTLTVAFGSTTQSYVVKAPDGPAVSANQFIFNPNEAINLTGTYATIGLGFSIDYGINLDDDQWDGLQ